MCSEAGATMEREHKRTRCDVYSRVVGYLQPTNRWNKGKRAEYADRQAYVLGADSRANGGDVDLPGA